MRFRRRTCRLLDRLVKQPASSEEIRLLFRNLEYKTTKLGLSRETTPLNQKSESKSEDTHKFLRDSTGKKPALISTMALLLRSSVSKARKGSSCSAKIPVILLFALKTNMMAPINDRNILA